MARGHDEPFTLYGLLAESVETNAARSFVTFRLNPRARFSDGQPVLAEDVLFSWRLMRDRAAPTTASTTPRWRRRRPSIARTVRFAFPTPTTASCR